MSCLVTDRTGKTCGAECELAEDIVCRFHRKTMNPSQKKRVTILWHTMILDLGNTRYDEGVKMYQCYHCGGWFPEGMAIGDHFPYNKSFRPELRYNLGNGVTSCKSCNQSGSQTRQKSLKSF